MRSLIFLIAGLVLGAGLALTLHQQQTTEQVGSQETEAAEVRIVTHVRIAGSRIAAICSPGESWSPRSVSEAILDTERDGIRYVVESTVNVEPMPRDNPTFLKTFPTDITADNLRSLERCDEQGSPIEPSDGET